MSIAASKPTSGAAAKAARDRARLNRARIDQERVQRDEQIENEATEFFLLSEAAEESRQQLAGIEEQLGQRVQGLRTLGEKDPRIAELLEVDVKEIARLAKLAVPPARAN